MKYAIIKNGRVENIILSDAAPENGVLVDGPCGIGWAYEDGAFVAPSAPLPVLTHKQFIDLFTLAEWGAWQNLIDGAAQTPVADRTALQVQQIASYRYFEKAQGVDLAETVTIAGVMALRSWGVLGSDARVTAVLANVAP